MSHCPTVVMVGERVQGLQPYYKNKTSNRDRRVVFFSNDGGGCGNRGCGGARAALEPPQNVPES